MGHHNNTISGVGKNKEEAKREAIADFMAQEGNRHSVRDCKALSMVKVPPKKLFKEPGKYGASYYKEDPTAPQSEWLEKWTFDLHTHA
jgi:hypothetical protein